MKLYSPKYYKDFKCIADKCSHSCCIGWEIDVDLNAHEKYKNSTHQYSTTIISSIENSETPHFRLDSSERCPHLNKNGLCEIILNLGEDYLCDICREHPRFYNDVNDGQEVGLGMACEEACRLILTSDDYAEISEIGEICGEIQTFDFDPRVLRYALYSILSDPSLSYKEKLLKIYHEYNITPSVIPDEDWQTILSSLEYLDEQHKTLFSKYTSMLSDCSKYEKQLERALAYFIYRHCTSALDEEEFRVSLGFCLFCERLFASVIYSDRKNELSDVIRIARIISEEIEYSEDNTEVLKFEFSC